MICPDCKTNMTILIDETVVPHSWGGFILYGCDKCKRTFWERFDYGDKEREIRKLLEKAKKENEKERKRKPPKYRPKPIWDPMHHHDSHLIN